MKVILNYPDYAITKEGQIWSKRFCRWLKSYKGTKGYLYIDLCKNKKRKSFRVHRLVLETFVGLCPDGMQCRHLNGNPSDNRLGNLCWGTPEENQHDRIRHGTKTRLQGEQHGRSKLTEQEVKEIWKLWWSNMTQKEIAKIYNVSGANISSIVNKKSWRHI